MKQLFTMTESSKGSAQLIRSVSCLSAQRSRLLEKDCLGLTKTPRSQTVCFLSP